MDRLKMAMKAPLAPIRVPTGQVKQVKEETVEDVHRWVDELVWYMEKGVFHKCMQESLLEYGMTRVMEEIVMNEAEQTARDVAEFVLQDE